MAMARLHLPDFGSRVQYRDEKGSPVKVRRYPRSCKFLDEYRRILNVHRSFILRIFFIPLLTKSYLLRQREGVPQ